MPSRFSVHAWFLQGAPEELGQRGLGSLPLILEGRVFLIASLIFKEPFLH